MYTLYNASYRDKYVVVLVAGETVQIASLTWRVFFFLLDCFAFACDR